ncbi:transglycosylase SLT domain-containing protein [Methylobacter sp. S3L5C]|nr:transglycosylase SLT domain-containing protein [Methylobacter sp. S3L5C]
MLNTNLQNYYQSSNPHFVETWQIRRMRQTTKIATSALLCLCVIIFGESCWALEKNHLLKNSIVATTQKRTAPFTNHLHNTLWWQIAHRHQLDPYILYAVALVESAKSITNHQVTPWPWAINKSGKSIIPASQQEAQTLLNKTLAEGSRNIDVGLMQINLHWQGYRVEKPEQLLNPVTNLQIGALVLAEAIQSAPNNLVLGIGRYHSWQNVSAAIAYGRKVLAVADQIRAVL